MLRRKGSSAFKNSSKLYATGISNNTNKVSHWAAPWNRPRKGEFGGKRLHRLGKSFLERSTNATARTRPRRSAQNKLQYLSQREKQKQRAQGGAPALVRLMVWYFNNLQNDEVQETKNKSHQRRLGKQFCPEDTGAGVAFSENQRRNTFWQVSLNDEVIWKERRWDILFKLKLRTQHSLCQSYFRRSSNQHSSGIRDSHVDASYNFEGHIWTRSDVSTGHAVQATALV